MNSSDKDTPRTSFIDTDASDDVAFYRALFSMRDSMRETCIPVVVLEKEDEYGFVKVQPIIRAVKQMSDRLEEFDRSPFFVKPMKFLHGGFLIHSPIFIGDTGYVISCDRDSTSAMKKNEDIMSEDSSKDEIEKNRLCKPDTIDCSHYIYGFFIPCSWVRDESESMKGMFGRDEGIFKDRLVISNCRKAGDEGSAFITIDREGNIMVATENSKAFVNKNGVQIANRTDKTNDSDLAKSRAIKIDGEKCWVYHNGENEDSEDTNGIVASKDGVDVEKILSVKNGELSATMNPKSLKSNAKFRVVRIITGDPERNGDIVSIPTAKITVLCDEPIEDDPLVFNVRDSDR